MDDTDDDLKPKTAGQMVPTPLAPPAPKPLPTQTAVYNSVPVNQAPYEPYHDDFKPEFYVPRFHGVVSQFANQTMTAPTAGVAHDLTRSGLGPNDTDVVARHMRQNPPPSSGPAQPVIPAALDHFRDSLANATWEQVKNAPWAGVMYDPNQKKYLVNPDHPAPISHQIGAVLHGVLDQAGSWAGNALEHIRETVPGAIATQMPLLDEGRTAEALINILSDPMHSGDKAVHEVAGILGIDPYQMQRNFREAAVGAGFQMHQFIEAAVSTEKQIAPVVANAVQKLENDSDAIAHHLLDFSVRTVPLVGWFMDNNPDLGVEAGGIAQNIVLDTAHAWQAGVIRHTGTNNGRSGLTALADKLFENDLFSGITSLVPGGAAVGAISKKIDIGNLFGGTIAPFFKLMDVHSMIFFHAAGVPLIHAIIKANGPDRTITSGFHNWVLQNFPDAYLAGHSIKGPLNNLAIQLDSELAVADMNGIPKTWEDAKRLMPAITTAVDFINPTFWMGGGKSMILDKASSLAGRQVAMRGAIHANVDSAWASLQASKKAAYLEAQADHAIAASQTEEINRSIQSARRGTPAAEIDMSQPMMIRRSPAMADWEKRHAKFIYNVSGLSTPEHDAVVKAFGKERIKIAQADLAASQISRDSTKTVIDALTKQIKTADDVAKVGLYKQRDDAIRQLYEIEYNMSDFRTMIGPHPRVVQIDKEITNIINTAHSQIEKLRSGGAGLLGAVPEGHVRLWRGAKVRPPGGPTKPPVIEEGHWFSDEAHYAADFAGYSSRSSMNWIDVPKEVADAAKDKWLLTKRIQSVTDLEDRRLHLGDMGVAGKQSVTKEPGFVLPEELAQTAKNIPMELYHAHILKVNKSMEGELKIRFEGDAKIKALEDEQSAIKAYHNGPDMRDIARTLNEEREAALAKELKLSQTRNEIREQLTRMQEGHNSPIFLHGRETITNLVRPPDGAAAKTVNGRIAHHVAAWKSTEIATNELHNQYKKLGAFDPELFKYIEDPNLPIDQLTQEQRDALSATQGLLAAHGEYLTSKEMIEALIQNYYPHVIERGPNGEMGAELQTLLEKHKVLSRNSPHFKPRVQDQMAALEQEGFKFKQNASDVLPQYIRSVAHADMVKKIAATIAESKVGSEIKNAAGLPAFREGPQWANIKGYRFVYERDGLGFTGWVHQSHEGIVKALVATRANTPGILKTLDKVNEFYRGAVMYNPLFHVYNQMSSQLQVHGAPLMPAVAGAKLAKDLPVYYQSTREMFLGYGQHMEGVVDKVARDNPWLGHQLQFLKNNPVIGAISSPVHKLNRGASDFLWKDVVHHGQIEAWWIMRAKAMNAGLAEADAGRAAGWLAERVAGARNPMYMAKFERDFMSRVFFAYGWTYKHAASLFETFGGEWAFMKQFVNQGISEEMAKYMSNQLRANMARYWVTATAHTEMLNYAINGNFTDKNQPGHELDIEITGMAKALGLDPAGERIYIRSPFMNYGNWFIGFIRDFQYQDAGPASIQAFLSKATPILNAPYQALNGLENNNFDFSKIINETLNPAYRTELQGLDFGKLSNEFLNAQRAGPNNMIPQGPATANLILRLLASVTGNNAVMYNARKSIRSTSQATMDEALMTELAKERINPYHATDKQKAAAQENIQQAGGPLGILSGKYAIETSAFFNQEQTAAAREFKIPEEQIQKNIADGRWLDGIDLLTKRKIYEKYPELKYWRIAKAQNSKNPEQAEAELETSQYNDDLEQARNLSTGMQADLDQQLKDKKITTLEWRTKRSDRLKELYAAIGELSKANRYKNAVTNDQQWQDYQTKYGGTPIAAQPEDTAYIGYINISTEAYKDADGNVDYKAWSHARQAYLNGLPDQYKDYIGQVENQHRTQTEQDYYSALDGYSKFKDANAELETQYSGLFDQGMTAKLRSTYLKEHPEVQQYITGRENWFQQHPTIAKFFHPLEEDKWIAYKPAVQAQKLAEYYYWYGHGHQDYLTPWEINAIQDPAKLKEITAKWGPTEQELMNQTYRSLGG